MSYVRSEYPMRGRIVLADAMGYCWGVRRTLEIIQRAGSPDDQIATIGDVIHNPHAVEQLRSHGIRTATSVEEAAKQGFRKVAITAHGASPERTHEAKRLGLSMVDTTCPLVTKVQRLAEKLVRQGYFIVVYGDRDHPEVRGIVGWANTSRVVAAKQLRDLPWNHHEGTPRDDSDDGPPRKVAVISQTTKIVDEFLAFARELTDQVAQRGGEVRICNTICAPTTDRQNALRRMASQVDVILVIGGRKSSNTTRLAELGRRHGVDSYHIESDQEISPEWLEGVRNVGITAGASTPDEVIYRVIDFLSEQGYARPDLADISGVIDLAEQPAY
jgi:4-hydroxy-3-methylbut-2-en-1-yl diphosphate reductase